MAAALARWRFDGPTLPPLGRREFMGTLASGLALVWLAPRVAHAATPSAQAPVRTTLRVNGTPRELDVDPRTTLLDALRERLQLTGTKKGCDHGQCGACTVHLDGRRVLSCLTLALSAAGREITTIEGVGTPEALHPVQQAFVACDGFQCGYCTPGQIMSAIALVDEPVGADDADVREHMSGNLCRCGAYPNIVAAVQSARRLLATGG
jgi:xanthine dehydrogenase YagT iron-sulfur-binding subunit